MNRLTGFSALADTCMPGAKPHSLIKPNHPPTQSCTQVTGSLTVKTTNSLTLDLISKLISPRPHPPTPPPRPLKTLLPCSAAQKLQTHTHQADELSVQPAQDVRALLRLGPVHRQPRHQDGRGLLVEGGGDALDLRLCVGPTGEGEGQWSSAPPRFSSNTLLRSVAYPGLCSALI